MLNVKDAIKFEKGTYFFKCLACSKEIKSKTYYLPQHSGKCRSCVMRGKPFAHVYKRFTSTASIEHHDCNITFEQFMEFTKINTCHYCSCAIPWKEYVYSNSKYSGGGYFLDRKENSQGYNIENVVVCCTDCNKAKGSRYSYVDWYGMTEFLRRKYNQA